MQIRWRMPTPVRLRLPSPSFRLGVAQQVARVLREHEAVRSIRTTETNHSGALRCGRSSMEEPWAVNPLVPVRLRPVTPKRMCIARRELKWQRTGLLPRVVRVQAPGDAPPNNPLVAESADAPVSEAGAAGHVRSTRTEGTNFQQSGSSAAEQRPHKAKAGGSCPPRTTSDFIRPTTTKEM